ncbi:MAG: BrnA antitoxin family protein [Spirochaetaceae bacterium]|jgi:uncharacterized protein (DUF4415 family)|nr:BrnA antitoxin family protein [Spirochaetaceae bacterium]
MATVRYELRAGTKPTPEQQTEIAAAAKRPVVYGEDCPRLTEAQLAEFKRVNGAERERVPCTIRLPRETLDWWKSRGAGYTSAMARVLDLARNNAELLRECL